MSDGWIVTNVEVLGGKPCVKGTRLSVEFLLELAASGATQPDVLARYPQLTADGLAAAFRFAARGQAASAFADDRFERTGVSCG